MTRAAETTLTVEEILEEACARNIPAELHYEPTRGGNSIFRVRLMALTETQILADAPVGRPGDKPIPANRAITVHFELKGVRRQFQSVIETHDVEVRLNKSKAVRGIALQIPESTEESQRRHDFRQILASCDPITVTLVPVASEFPDACLLDAPRAAGRLVELSAGGAGLIVQRRLMRELRTGMRFFITFDLPDVDDPFYLLASCRHIREIHEGEVLRVGWAFTERGFRTLTTDKRRIAKFVAAFQRRSLQRRT
jgi:c-di-GMP-binding flagellar brake protein YcgR